MLAHIWIFQYSRRLTPSHRLFRGAGRGGERDRMGREEEHKEIDFSHSETDLCNS